MALQASISRLLENDLDLRSADIPADARVLCRIDANVPVSSDGTIQDDTRIQAMLPTVQLLLARGWRVVLCSHLGQPNPAEQSYHELQQRYSLAPVARALSQLLPEGTFTGLVQDCIGSAAEAAAAALLPGQACLLENLRFHTGETANDPVFAGQLARLGDVYINDAFGVVHRDQASVTGVLAHFPGRCYPGLLLRTELQFLNRVRHQPDRPFGVVIGGAKVKDKIKVIQSLIQQADVILIGGRMAFTFLAAEGVAVGRTQIEEEWLEPCRAMRQLATAHGVQLLLPQDVVVAHNLNDDHGCCTVPLTPTCCSSAAPCVPEGCYGLDIGPKTAADFTQAIQGCKLVFWNGPMGRFEVPGFAAGTAAVAEALGRVTLRGSTTVVGGGDSLSAVKQLRPVPPISFMSTGGGASLELIRGQVLPAIKALADATMLGNCLN